MGEKISVEELFHLFSLSTVCLANLSYSPQATLGLPMTSYKMKNCKLFCRGENNFSNRSFVCSLENAAQVRTKKKEKVIKTSKSACKGRNLWTVCWNKPLKNYFPVSTVGFQSLPKTGGEEGIVLLMYFILSQFWFTSCWFQFCNQFYPGRPFHLGRDPVRAFHLCTRHNSPS